LVAPDAVLYLSSISVWEALLLGQKGRIHMKPDPVRWVRQAVANSPVNAAPLNAEIAIVSREMEMESQDPADRFIIATAKVFNATVITADRLMNKCKSIKCLSI